MKRILVLLAIVAVGLLVAGCEKATGGGFIQEVDPLDPEELEEKATFGFTTNCKSTPLENGAVAQIKGQLQYYDREADVRFHAFLKPITVELGDSDVTDACVFLDTIAEEEFGEDSFVLQYRVQGGPKEEEEEEDEGEVRIHVVDAGEPGINGDKITIQVLSGPYEGYTKEGTIEGGNIQVH